MSNNKQLSKKVNLLLTDEQHEEIQKLFPERGSFLYILRRCVTEVINNPGASAITIPLTFTKRTGVTND